MDCLQGRCQMQVGPLPFAEGISILWKTHPSIWGPFRFRKKHPWMTKAEIQKWFMLRECFFSRPSICSPAEELGQTASHSLALKHNKSLGKKSSTTSKSLDLKQRRTIMYFGIGFWACCLYLGLESTYSSSKCLLYFEEKCILSRIWEVGGTSKHEKSGFLQLLFLFNRTESVQCYN